MLTEVNTLLFPLITVIKMHYHLNSIDEEAKCDNTEVPYTNLCNLFKPYTCRWQASRLRQPLFEPIMVCLMAISCHCVWKREAAAIVYTVFTFYCNGDGPNSQWHSRLLDLYLSLMLMGRCCYRKDKGDPPAPFFILWGIKWHINRVLA